MIKKDPIIDKIKEEAKELGACVKADSIRGFGTAAALMLTPQGVEFLQRNPGWPSLELFREHKRQIRKFGIVVDTHSRRHMYINSAAFVGDTDVTINCHGTSTTHTFIVMYGAKITIEARNYAVVRIYNLGGQVTIINDGTARIL